MKGREGSLKKKKKKKEGRKKERNVLTSEAKPTISQQHHLCATHNKLYLSLRKYVCL
jgi:hypothetical protein